MTPTGSQRKIVRIVIVLALLGTLCICVAGGAAVLALQKAWQERKRIGFVVSTNEVVFRTPNSELLAPPWNEPVTLADPTTFKTIFQSPNFCLGTDSKTVFMGEGKRVYRLLNGQASTFRLLTPDGRFTCDAQNVYYLGFQLPQADPKTFQILGRFTSKDASRVYIGPALLAGADPSTFRLEKEGELESLDATYSQGPCTIKQYRAEVFDVRGFRGRDKNRIFGGLVRPR